MRSPALLAAAVRDEPTPEAAAMALLAALYAPMSDSGARPDRRRPAALRARDAADAARRPPIRPAAARRRHRAELPCGTWPLRSLPDDTSPDRTDGVAVVEALLGLLSLARAEAEGAAGGRLLGVDVQLWVREVSRIDRHVATEAVVPLGRRRHARRHRAVPARAVLPALRPCRVGRAADRHRPVRRRDPEQRPRGRPPAGISVSGPCCTPQARRRPSPRTTIRADGLRWLDTDSLELVAEPGGRIADPDEQPGGAGADMVGRRPGGARRRRCPSCRQPDGIRFLGSGVATLTSVTLSALFGSGDLDPAEKKTLLFTDSVQDAAYTAGFVQARSHALSLRAALLDTIAAVGPLSLDDVAREAVQRAGDDPVRRYRLVPPAVAEWAGLPPVLAAVRQPVGPAEGPRPGRAAPRFDVALEFGLNARTGRTLELTGSAVAEVDIGSTEAVLRVARRAIGRAREQHSLSPDTDAVLGADLDDGRLLAGCAGSWNACGLAAGSVTRGWSPTSTGTATAGCSPAAGGGPATRGCRRSRRAGRRRRSRRPARGPTPWTA